MFALCIASIQLRIRGRHGEPSLQPVLCSYSFVRLCWTTVEDNTNNTWSVGTERQML